MNKRTNGYNQRIGSNKLNTEDSEIFHRQNSSTFNPPAVVNEPYKDSSADFTAHRGNELKKSGVNFYTQKHRSDKAKGLEMMKPFSNDQDDDDIGYVQKELNRCKQVCLNQSINFNFVDL